MTDYQEEAEVLRKVIIDFKDEISPTNYKTLDNGIYVLRFLKMLRKQWDKVNENGEREQYLVGYFEIENEGKKFWVSDYFSLGHQKRWKIRMFLKEMGLSEQEQKISVDFETLYGRTIKAYVSKKPKIVNGVEQFSNYIKSYSKHIPENVDKKEI